MSRFHYTARGPHGPVQGTLEGASAAAVADELRVKGWVPLLRALNGLQETAINPTFKTVVGDLRRSLEAGVDLSAAMAQHPKVFDNFYVSMVRVGEASGQLEEVFRRLAEHLLFEASMRQQVKSAMRYPSFVVMAMAGAIGVINVMVIPSFAGVFKSMGAELPILTKLLVATSDFTVNNGGTLMGAVSVLFMLWRA